MGSSAWRIFLVRQPANTCGDGRWQFGKGGGSSSSSSSSSSSNGGGGIGDGGRCGDAGKQIFAATAAAGPTESLKHHMSILCRQRILTKGLCQHGLARITKMISIRVILPAIKTSPSLLSSLPPLLVYRIHLDSSKWMASFLASFFLSVLHNPWAYQTDPPT